jgi:hypothetical protein
MNLHIGGGLLIGCLTLVGYLHGILPWSIGHLQTISKILHDDHMFIDFLLEMTLCIGGGGEFGISKGGH